MVATPKAELFDVPLAEIQAELNRRGLIAVPMELKAHLEDMMDANSEARRAIDAFLSHLSPSAA